MKPKVRNYPDRLVQCPGCGLVAQVDEDQFRGEVSIDCPDCEYHERHDLRYGEYLVDSEQASFSEQMAALHEARRLIEEGEMTHAKFPEFMMERLAAVDIDELERKMPQLFKDLPIYDTKEESMRNVYEALEYMAEINNG